ncbi:extracellular solute-binding protein [Paenibacillus sp. GCM10027627]|uniref:ABC transporter substrate-binding protein n=1 Tax=unclassified Paenibacillus TaxID=185978 RepID=UPI00363CCB89
MSPRKNTPLLIGALLLAALLLFYFYRTVDPVWSPVRSTGEVQLKQSVSGEPKSSGQIDINVTVSLPNYSFSKLWEQTERFMDKYPHIKVHLANEFQLEDRYDHVSAQLGQGVAPDVLLLDNSWIVPFAVKGYLKPNDSLMTGDVLSDQLIGLIEPLKWNGYLWGTPFSINPYVIVWNKELLAEAGLAEPPSNWESCLALWEKLHNSQDGQDTSRLLTHFSPGDLLQLLVFLSRFDTEQSGFMDLKAFSPSQRERLMGLQALSTGISSVSMDRKEQLNELIAQNRLLVLALPWGDLNALSEPAQDKLLIEKNTIYYPWMNGSSFVIYSGSRSETESMLWIQEMTSDYASGMRDSGYKGELPVRASSYLEHVQWANSSGDLPPTWWYEALHQKEEEGKTITSDPIWPERWQRWATAWRIHSSAASPHFEAFMEAIQPDDPS